MSQHQALSSRTVVLSPASFEADPILGMSHSATHIHRPYNDCSLTYFLAASDKCLEGTSRLAKGSVAEDVSTLSFGGHPYCMVQLPTL